MSLKILPKSSGENLLTHTETNMWVDEAIWGHRLYDEQTPWLTILEFLNIVQAQLEEGRVFEEKVHNQLVYNSYNRLYIRNILFNNPFLESVNNEFNSDEERWQKWLYLMKENSGGIRNHEPDFSYLKNQFKCFDDFVKIVRFLQLSSIEGDSNKRWSSKFVFPYGVNCLYQDLKVDKNSNTNDRRFFARTGELLYLMISRTDKKQEILEHLERIGIVGYKNQSKWDKLVAALQPSDGKEKEGEGKNKPPYLPYERLDEFDNLAQDWLNIFRCHLPGYDCLPHLVIITGLHLVIYLLKRAVGVLNNDDAPELKLDTVLEEQPTFILEIVGPKKTIVRNLSCDSFALNTNLTEKAVGHYVNRLSQLPRWQSCDDLYEGTENARRIIREEIYYKDDELNGNSPSELLKEVTQQAITRHKQHLGKCHQTWLKEIGLVSSKGSRRTRYVPGDALLKTLVLCCVEKRMEFQEFLQTLFDKYGFIIGDKQAKEIIYRNEADQEDFADNAELLEQRLASLGLLKRLSDACAYVINPYAVEEK